LAARFDAAADRQFAIARLAIEPADANRVVNALSNLKRNARFDVSDGCAAVVVATCRG